MKHLLDDFLTNFLNKGLTVCFLRALGCKRMPTKLYSRISGMWRDGDNGLSHDTNHETNDPWHYPGYWILLKPTNRTGTWNLFWSVDGTVRQFDSRDIAIGYLKFIVQYELYTNVPGED